ncbi:MAG: DUF72 domain-containing protein [Acidiferrobacterales bacterium]
MKASARIRVGCCGFPMAQPAYHREFPLVEVQQTFYQPPQSRALQRWREQAPPEFQFTIKAWQLITHTPASPTYRRLRKPVPADKHSHYGAFRPTPEVAEAWQVTLQAAQELSASIIVFQCPAAFTPESSHVRHLRRFFGQARADAGHIRLAWEPRGAWPVGTFVALCEEFDLIPVMDPFTRAPIAELPRYFRLHCVTG